MSYKPSSYPDVSPYLIVEGAEGTLSFLEATFGAERLRRFDSPDGKVHHAEVRIGDSVVMLADAIPPEWPAVPASIHLYVEDVDATYRRALDAGAESVQEPAQKNDPDKRGGVRDAGGTTWWISTMIGDPEESGE